MPLHRQVPLLKAQRLKPQGLHQLGQQQARPPSRPGHQQPRAGHPALGRLAVAGVGDIIALPLGHQHQALAVKPHGIVFPGRTGNEQPVQLKFLQPGRDFAEMIHGLPTFRKKSP
ncbi:hypothetical protein SDC9_153736 [bioreactor metagenome]|uniref:Uncharacterized protein n=1 Tax=bioreactor metagenome TaxID=1076179 RepID=A0A645EYD2_9ZZZZ